MGNQIFDIAMLLWIKELTGSAAIMGLAMLIITALIGTRDLGQETLVAMAKLDSGRGIIAGLCVAIIAIISDRLISTWSRRKAEQYGFSQ